MPSETIRDFLVSLGWDIKPAEQKRFIDAIETATLKAKLLGDALEAVAIKVTEAVTNMAEGFDRLYFVSQRTGATIETIRALGYAASQSGSSISDMNAEIETLSKKIRENPRGGAYIAAGIGFNPDLTYNRQLGERFAHLSKTQQEQRGDMAGVSPALLEALRHPAQFEKFIEEAQKSLATTGVGGDSAKAANDFMTQFRTNWMQLNNLAEGGLTRLLKGLTPVLKDFDDYLKSNQGAISAKLNEIANSLVRVISELERWLKGVDWTKVEERFDKFADDAKKLADSVGGMTTAFEIFFGIWATAKAVEALRVIGVLANALGLIGGAAGLIGGAFGASQGLGGDSPPPGTVKPGNETPEQLRGDADKSGATEGWGDWAKRKWTERPKFMGGTGAPPESSSASPANSGVPYAATSMTQGTGFSQAQYDAFKEGLTDIEGKRYDRMGGAGGRFAGRYQMGGAEITETAARLGIPRPTTEEFLKNPALQEQFMENYTLDHYNQLMKNPVFANMSPDKKLQMLGYAHNQGVRGAIKYLNGGGAGADAWGTSGTAYFAPIAKRLAAIPVPGAGVTKSANGEFVKGNWVGKGGNTDPRIWKPNGGGVVDSGDLPPEYRGLPPDPSGWGAVKRDNAAGTLDIQKRSAASPFGDLQNYWNNTPPLGLSGPVSGDVTHINAPQTTQIHIDGANDPSIVAHMVAANQGRVASDMARTLQGATN